MYKRHDENHVAIPSLLAVAALQQYLVKTKKRTSLSLDVYKRQEYVWPITVKISDMKGSDELVGQIKRAWHFRKSD